VSYSSSYIGIASLDLQNEDVYGKELYNPPSSLALPDHSYKQRVNYGMIKRMKEKTEKENDALPGGKEVE
jgi:hypothetical protein